MNRDPNIFACSIAACTRCDEHTKRCLACLAVPGSHRSFLVDEVSGTCYSPADLWVQRVGSWILEILIVGLVVALAAHAFIILKGIARAKEKAMREALHLPTGNVFGAPGTLSGKESDPLCPKQDPEALPASPEDAQSEAKRSADSINHGLLSWLQMQMHDWEMKGRSEPARYNFHTNLRERYIVGVGLPLFHGFQALVFVSAAITTIMLFLVQKITGMGDLLTRAKDQYERLHHIDKEVLQGAEFHAYATAMFYGTGGLYCVLLVIAVAFSYQQRIFVRRFNVGNSCMNDFVVQLSRLPENLTCESRLKEVVERQFQCAGEVLGVSIAYDLQDAEVRGTIERLVEHAIVRSDVKFNRRNDGLVRQGWSYPEDLARPEILNSADEQEFRNLYGKLRGSGNAFAVFKKKSVCSAVTEKYNGMWIRYEATPTDAQEFATLKVVLSEACQGKYLDAEGLAESEAAKERPFARLTKTVEISGEIWRHGTRVYDPDSIALDKPMVVERMAKVIEDSKEPTTALWSNMGQARFGRTGRMFKGICKVLKVWTLIGVLVYAPIVYFITIPFGLAQSSPSPLTGQLMGITLAICGALISNAAWDATAHVGFHSKTKQDAVFVVLSTAMNLINTGLFGGGSLIFHVAVGFNSIDMSELDENTSKTVLREIELFNAYYGFLIPGWLGAGVILGKFVGIVNPLVQSFVISRLAFVWRWVPRKVAGVLCLLLPGCPPPTWLSAREAEKLFSPPPVPIAWEYNLYIVTPSVCFLVLFVMSADAWMVFAALAGWALMMWALHRFALLPISKKETTGSTLEEIAEKLWGIPLAIVLASFGFWGVRCEALGSNDAVTSYWIVLMLFLLGWLGHQYSLSLLAPHLPSHTDLVDRSYDEVRNKLRYTWFNANPVHVLKSRYYPEKLGRDAVLELVPFEFGKEYLQLDLQLD